VDAAPEPTASPEEFLARQHERERHRREVGVRVTVTGVDRHVPSLVTIEVHDLLEDLEDLKDPATPDEEAGS
jgi:hypothetical protein